MEKQKRGIKMDYTFGSPTQNYIKYDLKPGADKDLVKIKLSHDLQRGCEEGIIRATKKLIQAISFILQQEEE